MSEKFLHFDNVAAANVSSASETQGQTNPKSVESVEGKVQSIDVDLVRREYDKIEQNLQELNKKISETNEDMLRLKHSALISTGAKLSLGRLLGK